MYFCAYCGVKKKSPADNFCAECGKPCGQQQTTPRRKASGVAWELAKAWAGADGTPESVVRGAKQLGTTAKGNTFADDGQTFDDKINEFNRKLDELNRK